MSRFRLGTLLAAAGILITTGGCTGSATAPEAANVAPTHEEGEAAFSSGFIFGGGRTEGETQAP